jgi:hypothetical protein
MVCKSCTSSNQEQFTTEIAIHAEGPTEPLVFVFPKIFVCMNCGKMEIAEEFVVPVRVLQSLALRTHEGFPNDTLTLKDTF